MTRYFLLAQHLKLSAAVATFTFTPHVPRQNLRHERPTPTSLLDLYQSKEWFTTNDLCDALTLLLSSQLSACCPLDRPMSLQLRGEAEPAEHPPSPSKAPPTARVPATHPRQRWVGGWANLISPLCVCAIKTVSALTHDGAEFSIFWLRYHFPASYFESTSSY